MPLTKSDCIQFVEIKRNEVLEQVHSKYDENIDRAKQRILKMSGYREVIDSLQKSLDSFLESYYEFIDEVGHEEGKIQGVLYNIGRYGSIEYHLNQFRSNNYFTESMLEGLKFETPAIKELIENHSRQVNEICIEYEKVTSVLKKFRNAAKCVEYLEGLGFEVQSLRDSMKEEFMPLATPIDVSKLFVVSVK